MLIHYIIDCIDINIFTPEEIKILETMKNNYNKEHKLLEVIYINQKYTVEEYDICDFMEEINIEKICEIFNYLDDGEYYNDNYGFEYIKYKFTYNYIDIILEQYNYKELTGSISNKLIIKYCNYKINMDYVENIKKIFGFLFIK